MENKKSNISVAVIGFGNVGEYGLKAVEDAEDMDVGGIVVKEKYVDRTKKYYPDYKVVTKIEELDGIDIALLCIPSLSIPTYAPELLKKGINTVDSFDLHGDELLKLKKTLHNASLKGNAVSVTAAGWDPGTNSLIRGIFQAIAPKGITHTNFGPGMSMGHSVAVKKIDGVKEALSITVPKGIGTHSRVVYVEIEEGYELTQVEKDLRKSEYFKNCDLQLYEVDNVKNYLDFGHGVYLTRKGVSSQTHNQMMEFDLKITNPAVTAQIMVSSARAAVRQEPGNYFLLELPMVDLLGGNKESVLHKLV